MEWLGSSETRLKREKVKALHADVHISSIERMRKLFSDRTQMLDYFFEPERLRATENYKAFVYPLGFTSRKTLRIGEDIPLHWRMLNNRGFGSLAASELTPQDQKTFSLGACQVFLNCFK